MRTAPTACGETRARRSGHHHGGQQNQTTGACGHELLDGWAQRPSWYRRDPATANNKTPEIMTNSRSVEMNTAAQVNKLVTFKQGAERVLNIPRDREAQLDFARILVRPNAEHMLERMFPHGVWIANIGKRFFSTMNQPGSVGISVRRVVIE